MVDTTSELRPVVVTGRRPLRRPRGRILLNGVVATQLLDAQVSRTNYFVGDTFDGVFAVNGDAAHDLEWWMTQDEIEVQVDLGKEADDGTIEWKPMLKGKADGRSYDHGRQTVSIHGRDLTARFIENKVSKTFQNRTSSEIIAELAQGRGLKADVTATSKASGTFYQKDHSSTHLDSFKNAIEWDLMVHLARCEGFELWVDSINETVHFHPWKEDDDPFIVLAEVADQEDGLAKVGRSNVLGLTIDQDLSLAKDVRVIVRSWHSGLGKGFKAQVGKAKPAEGSDDEDVPEFAYSIPDLTQAECDAYAARYHDQHTRHEYTVQFDAPASTSLDPRRGLRIDGLPVVGDQTFYIDDVALRIDSQSGFTMNVRAKNHPEPGDSQ